MFLSKCKFLDICILLGKQPQICLVNNCLVFLCKYTNTVYISCFTKL